MDAFYPVPPTATFGELVEKIVESRFLQYSSTHIALQGEVDGKPVVRVFSPLHTHGREAQFQCDAHELASRVIGSGSLQFRFVFE